MGLCKALVVDDSRAWRDELTEVLQDMGAEVIVASDRRSALSVLADESFDIAIIDVNLAGETYDFGGFAINRYIQDHSPGTQVILISAESLTAKEIVTIQPARFVEKPNILRQLNSLPANGGKEGANGPGDNNSKQNSPRTGAGSN
jgi:DNA-binding NtrC family response regulator